MSFGSFDRFSLVKSASGFLLVWSGVVRVLTLFCCGFHMNSELKWVFDYIDWERSYPTLILLFGVTICMAKSP